MAIDKIGSAAITDCTVVAADIAPGTVTNAKLAGSIANAKLANSSVTINGSTISLGASGSIPAVSWQSVVVSDGSTVTTMEAGKGYFLNNTSAAGIVKLPASASAGDTVAIKDYAGNFGTNKLTIQRNSHKIQGAANDSLIGTNRASVTLVYADATKGWLYANESNVGDLQNAGFIEATGGTVTTQTNHKVHSFTGDGCFVVSQLGFGSTPCAEATQVEYLVVAGGGGGGNGNGGGGGGGGFRMASGFTVTAATFPITVGGGGAAVPASTAADSPAPSPNRSATGSNSVFATITSKGGGGGGGGLNPGPGNQGRTGGSGGGGGTNDGCGGAGNTPPVSPPQGNPGGDAGGPGSGIPFQGGGGGGGAAAQGTDVAPSPQTAGPGGAGSPAAPVFGSAPQPFYIANGSCRGNSACGQFSGGGGGGAGSTPSTPGGDGGVGGGGDGTNAACTAVS